METNRFRIAALGLVVAAPLALAQDVGFFRPAADPALTTTLPIPPQPPAPPPPPQSPAPAVTVNETAQMAAAELAATRQEDAMRWAEQQADRSQSEAQQAREQSVQPTVPNTVGAAFTGLTSERDR